MSRSSLYEGFHGEAPRRNTVTGLKFGTRWITRPGSVNILVPATLSIMGRVNALDYDTVRDGESIQARHVFAPGSRPVLAVGPGRGQIFLLGERYRFTDRGIVDYDAYGAAIDYDEKTGQIKPLR